MFSILEVVEAVDHIVKMALIIRQAVISGISRSALLVLLRNRFIRFATDIFLFKRFLNTKALESFN